jgi:hypothetical protein
MSVDLLDEGVGDTKVQWTIRTLTIMLSHAVLVS